MKAITLWQPWASLWASGAKIFETRGRAIQYRGPIAIHAAKKPFDTAPFFGSELCLFANALGLPDIYSFDELPYGAIIATTEIIGCYPIVSRTRIYGKGVEAVIYKKGERVSITSDELLFGDWRPGRFAWEVDERKILPEPVYVSGKQGLWNWEGVI